MLGPPLPLIPPPGGARRCTACSGALAADQRYCVRCGAPTWEPAWALAEPEPELAPETEAPAGSAARLPAPRSTALLTLLVLAVGVFIGGAFGPRSADTLADESNQPVVVVAQSPAPAPVRPASPAGDSGTSVFGDTGGTAAPASDGSATAAVAAAAPVAGTAGATEPSDGLPTGDVPAGGDTTVPGTNAAPPSLPPVKHVFVIALATPDSDHLLGAQAPAYVRSELISRGVRLSGYRPVAGGLGGRIAAISGQAPTAEIRAGCPTYGAGCLFARTVKSLADQLSAAGLSWRAYAGGLATPCRHPAPGAADDTAADRPTDHFAVAGVPFLYFHSVIDTGDCNAGVVPLERLHDDVSSAETTPNFVYVAPDRCHDGRATPCADGQPGGASAADAFLRQWIPPLLASPAYRQDGMLVVLGGGSDRGEALLVSRYLHAGRAVRTRYDTYALLRTVEDLMGVGHLGRAAAATVKPFGSDVFAASAQATSASRSRTSVDQPKSRAPWPRPVRGS